MTTRRSGDSQFDFFIPAIVDLKFRDQQDTMERPFFSLSKSKRIKPIEYRSARDGIFVTVRPHPEYGMATIWDADILIWAASVICDLRNRKINEVPRKLHFQPYDLLKAIGRGTSGAQYKRPARGHGAPEIDRHPHQHPRPAWQEGSAFRLDLRMDRPCRQRDRR